jgi:hypothetical protein
MPHGKLQIIDGQDNFRRQELESQMSDWGLMAASQNYHVVSIFGSQSSGKSTLLNELFGTNFQVMSSTQREQTTKGIWMTRAPNTNLLIMDVEGTDSQERNGDPSFNHKSTLFSLAASDVVIINIWENQVGLNAGANLPLLKNVLQAALSLEEEKPNAPHTLLLFVIHDVRDSSPLESLQETLSDSMERVWQDIAKPTQLVNTDLSDYFQIQYLALPHFDYRTEEFRLRLQALQGRFVDPGCIDYLLRPEYHNGTDASDIAMFMELNWEQIQNNAEIKLPDQREIIAVFRINDAFDSAIRFVEEKEVQAKRRRIANDTYKEVESIWEPEILATFDSAAAKYNHPLYHTKRRELEARLTKAKISLWLQSPLAKAIRGTAVFAAATMMFGPGARAILAALI